MNKEDLGEYFIKDNEIYQVIGYIQNPALELKNINTGQKEIVVIDSKVSEEYSKLFFVPCEKDGYHLDKAEPVKNIKLESF